MAKEVIITHIDNVTSEGVTLHTNITATLKTGALGGTSHWVAWDKIGKDLFHDYTEKITASDLDKLRKGE